MNNSIAQSVSIAVNSAAFSVLDYSDSLNSLTSRITGGRINRNTLAESVINQATTLGLDIARDNETVNQYAQSLVGMKGSDLMEHVENVVLSTNQEKFSDSVHHVIKSSVQKQVGAGAIPQDFADTIPEFATDMVNNYVGKQAIHQFLGAYAENHDWEDITRELQAQVTDNSSSYKDLLMLAGARVTSNLVKNLVMRGIVETAPANTKSSPEMTLAAGCLSAYLSKNETCESALNAYTPVKPLVDDKFINVVTDLGVQYAQHSVNNAADLVREVDGLIEKLQLSGEILNPVYRDLEPDDEGSIFPVKLSTPAMDAAAEMMHNAKEAYREAQNFAQMTIALKAILVADPSISNEERLSSALTTLLKSVPLNSTLAPILANTLALDNGLPAQNILGTFVKIYGWDALQNMLLEAVEKHLDNLHDIYAIDKPPLEKVDETAKATQPDPAAVSNLETSSNSTVMASTKFAVKLAIVHLKPYINEGNFDKSDSEEYKAIAKIVHDNKTVLTSGDMSVINIGVNTLPTVQNYLTNKIYTAASTMGDAAASSYEYSASVLQAGSASAMTAVYALSAQIQETGLVGTLQSHAVSVGTGTANYASNAAGSAAASAYSWFGSMMPDWNEISAVRI